MKDLKYVIMNFFTNEEYLVSPELIPGTLFSPLHFIFEAFLISLIVISAIYIGKRKELIKPVFKSIFFFLIVMEIGIITWDSLSGSVKGIDFKEGLSLYPCSIFMYCLPFIIWGKGLAKKAACGYIFTLGLVGSLINLIYPYRLTTYSCLSFPAMHSMIYHGLMFFGYLVLLISKEHSYSNCYHFKELFYPCIPTLMMSIPANILNYSSLDSDYMYFKGYYPVFQMICPNIAPIKATILLYLVYIMIPALIYLPGYILNSRENDDKKFNVIYLKEKFLHGVFSS